MSWLFICLGAFAGAIGGHAAVCRLSGRLNRVARFLVVGGLAGAMLLIAVGSRYDLRSVEFLSAVLLFAFLCELYIFLFTMTISSISSNILVHLAKKPMTVTEVIARYDSRQMVQLRLERLIDTGFLEIATNGIVLSAKGIRFIRVFDFLRTVFRHSAR